VTNHLVFDKFIINMKRCSLLMMASLLALFGCGEKVNPAFGTLVEKAMNDLQTKTASHQAVWGLGKSDRWDLNQDDGNLIFTFPDKTVTCEAQIIGSFDKTKGTWLWSWDNPGVATNLTQASRWLRDYGTKKQYEKLTRPEWKATENEAWEMVALATLLCNAQGAYRGPAGEVGVFMTFGAPKIQKR
jgi:hypothetical protein